jgi:hypothetical protein
MCCGFELHSGVGVGVGVEVHFCRHLARKRWSEELGESAECLFEVIVAMAVFALWGLLLLL